MAWLLTAEHSPALQGCQTEVLASSPWLHEGAPFLRAGACYPSSWHPVQTWKLIESGRLEHLYNTQSLCFITSRMQTLTCCWGHSSAYLVVFHHQVLDAINHAGTFAGEWHGHCCIWRWLQINNLSACARRGAMKPRVARVYSCRYTATRSSSSEKVAERLFANKHAESIDTLSSNRSQCCKWIAK